jgi:hypothetical protein
MLLRRPVVMVGANGKRYRRFKSLTSRDDWARFIWDSVWHTIKVRRERRKIISRIGSLYSGSIMKALGSRLAYAIIDKGE